MTTKSISFHPRPLPYFNTGHTLNEQALAKALRREFIPKIKRRLPGHHLRGFTHPFITDYVVRQKKQYPFFLRTDIEKFYPSIDHQQLLVNMQLAYKELLSLQYVPAAFKKKYLHQVAAWCREQPLTRGIPLGSPLSAILAPVMLVPLWLQIKRMFNVPMLVFMDDVLIFAQSREQLTDIYVYLENSLGIDYRLRMNLGKTQTGRFATDRVDFCGWEFCGGYARISERKKKALIDRLSVEHERCKKKDLQVYIKRMNRKIDGFGHYYKYGDTRKQFEELDIQIRRNLRMRLNGELGRFMSNAAISTLGLRTLSGIAERVQKTGRGRTGRPSKSVRRRLSRVVTALPVKPAPGVRSATALPEDLLRVVPLLEKVNAHLVQQTRLLRSLALITKNLTELPLEV